MGNVKDGFWNFGILILQMETKWHFLKFEITAVPMGRKCQHRDASRGRRLLGMTPSSFGHVDPEEVGPVTPLAPVLTTVCLPLPACPLGSHHSLTCQGMSPGVAPLSGIHPLPALNLPAGSISKFLCVTPGKCHLSHRKHSCSSLGKVYCEYDCQDHAKT